MGLPLNFLTNSDESGDVELSGTEFQQSDSRVPDVIITAYVGMSIIARSGAATFHLRRKSVKIYSKSIAKSFNVSEPWIGHHHKLHGAGALARRGWELIVSHLKPAEAVTGSLT